MCVVYYENYEQQYFRHVMKVTISCNNRSLNTPVIYSNFILFSDNMYTTVIKFTYLTNQLELQ
jgi:hypothetical protein